MDKYGKCHSPEMKLVLISLWHSSQGMKMAEELDSVMRLDVMHPIAKHFQQSMQNSPCMRFEHRWQELTLWKKVGKVSFTTDHTLKYNYRVD